MRLAQRFYYEPQPTFITVTKLGAGEERIFNIPQVSTDL
jgi:hypothetical protein